MKKRVGLVAGALSMAIAFSSVGCAGFGDDGTVKIDEGKTQLSIYVYAGGLGAEWTKEVAKEFEEFYADYQGENGKVGVQVLIDSEEKYDALPITTGLKNKTYTWDVVYSDDSAWDTGFADAGVTADISNTLKEKVYDEDGELAAKTGKEAVSSILDKMDDFFVDRYDAGNGTYQAFPFQDSLFGFIYDADLIDGKKYSEPQTMDEFYDLLDTFVNDSITPFTWNGAYSFYYTPLTEGIMAQYGGQELINAHLTYTGTHTLKSTGETVNITPKNAYLLADSEAMYQACDYIYNITKDSRYYSSNAFLGSQTHTVAQGEFILSERKAKRGEGQRIAMLLDGDFWENESRAAFDEMEAYGENYGYGKRNFKLMPIPVMDGQADETKRYVSGWGCGATAFVNKESKVQDLASKWIQFQHTRDALATFTTHTGSVLPYDYELTDEEYGSITPFSQSIYDLRRDENVIIYRHVGSCEYRDLSTLNMFGVKGGLAPDNQKVPMYAFRTDSSLTVDKYYQAILDTFTKTKWEREYNAVCERFGKEF